MAIEWIGPAVKIAEKIIPFFKPLKNKWVERKRNKKARKLYVPLKEIVFDAKENFDYSYSYSFPRITENLTHLKDKNGLPNLELQKIFAEIHLRNQILKTWFSCLCEELRLDDRKPNMKVLMLTTMQLNYFLQCLGNDIVWRLNDSLGKLEALPSEIKVYYPDLKEKYNYFINQYEAFLKKCHREVQLINPNSFQRLNITKTST